MFCLSGLHGEIIKKTLLKNKTSFQEIAYRITWGFQAILQGWWVGLSQNQNDTIFNVSNPLDTLIDTTTHRFVG